MGTTVIDLMRPNLEKYQRLAPKFKHLFGRNLMEFWDHLTGFDLGLFDERVTQAPDGKSIEDCIMEWRGQEGVDLIKRLIEAPQR